MIFKSLKKNPIFDYIYLILLTLSSIVVFVPLNPIMPARGLDHSWVLSMNQAVGQNLILGKDLIFTFGPFASVYSGAFHPSTNYLMLIASLYIAAAFILLSFKILENTNLIIKLINLLLLFLIFVQNDSFYFIYCLFLIVYIHNISNNKIQNNNLVLILCFSLLGLLPLIKGTAIITSIASIIISSLILVKEKKFKQLSFVIISPLISLCFLWVIAGQSILNIFTYFKSITEIIKGYSEAMSLEGDILQIKLYIISSIFIIFNVIFSFKNSIYSTTILVFGFSLSLFLGFKAGFVRHDSHAIIAANVVLATAYITLLIESKYFKYKIFSIIFATLVFSFIHNTYHTYSGQNIYSIIFTPFKNSYIGIANRFNNFNYYSILYSETIKKLAIKSKIDLLEGSTDIYSYNQTDLISSENKWNPRPIFQSYSAYTKNLLNINKEHLLSDQRPDNIIFNLETIDGRFPSLDDGVSWPILLNDYELTNNKNRYLLLKHKSRRAKLEEKLISSSSQQFNKEIFIPSHNKLLYTRINIKQTLLGKLFNIIYKPTQLIIKIRLDTGEIKNYRLISEMSDSNFLISNLVENNQDFKNIFLNKNDKKIESIMLESPKGNLFWNNNFEINFIEISE